MSTTIDVTHVVPSEIEDTGGTSDLARHEIEELTTQFYVTLRASVARLSADAQVHDSGSVAQIQALISRKGKPTWSRAYEIEQLLVDVIDDKTLEVELQTRLLEAKATLKPPLADHYAERAREENNPEGRRALLARLVNDLQWRYTVNEVKRAYSKEITGRTGAIFITALIAFALTVMIMALFNAQISRVADSRPLMLLLAGLAGAWGAGFSMLSSLKARLDAADLDDLKLMKARSILWSRPLIGVGAACVLYFFLASGLLNGAAFPNLESSSQPVTGAAAGLETSQSQVPTPVQSQPERKQFALLIVWCFLAGFSERLVPALLAKTEDERTKPTQVPVDKGSNRKSPDDLKPS
jgi:hypothetical protein